jgi:hypothetical protein
MGNFDPQLILLLAVACLLIYGVIAGIFMAFSYATIRYRKSRYQDDRVFRRWLLIPILLPLRICYALVVGAAKAAKWMLFIGVGLIALILSPLYFLVFTPMTKAVQTFNESRDNYEKFIEFFKSGIQLGQWVMFYKSEQITAERPHLKSMTNVRSRYMRPGGEIFSAEKIADDGSEEPTAE